MAEEHVEGERMCTLFEVLCVCVCARVCVCACDYAAAARKAKGSSGTSFNVY